MDRDQLRAKQSPLKAHYRADAAVAQITLRAEGTLMPSAVGCEVMTAAGPLTLGLHPSTGGDGTLACSGELLLQALVGCAGVTMAAVALAMGIPLRSGRIKASGRWDARGTLAISPEAPVGLQAIHLVFEVDTDTPAEQLNKLLELTERYCVVMQTLRHAPGMTSAVVVIPVTRSVDRAPPESKGPTHDNQSTL
jgi:uncharacterized OsmC-like protein